MHARAFSLVELVLCIGIVMVLIGLAIPQIRCVRESAVLTRETAQLRSNAQLVFTHCADHSGAFPLADERLGSAKLNWYLALNTPNARLATDPDGVSRRGVHRFLLGAAFVGNSAQMSPGRTVPPEFARSRFVRDAEVLFPAIKGMMVKHGDSVGGELQLWTYMTVDPPKWPVVMCDGSALHARCTDFRLAFDFRENNIGHPVVSTWYGTAGWDARK